MNENIVDKIFGNDGLWKDKYRVGWCDLCGTAYIACPEKDCQGTSCNSTGCTKCIEDFKEFNETVKTYVEDYLTDEERQGYYKGRRLEKLIVRSISKGEKEIDWKRMEKDGEFCENDLRIFRNLMQEKRA